MGLERSWHVSDRNVAFERSMSENVTVKGVRVLDVIVCECTQHVGDGRFGQVGGKHAACVLEVLDMMALMSSSWSPGLVSWQRAMRDDAFNLAARVT